MEDLDSTMVEDEDEEPHTTSTSTSGTRATSTPPISHLTLRARL
jgi:hypothetical protein